jgi:hypothetical protein
MFIISFAGALQALMLSFMGANDLKGLTLGFNRFTSVNPLANLVNSTELVVQSLLLVIIMIFFILVAVWLWLIMIVRKAMLMILVTVAPLAFFLNIMPFTETYYKKWWASFWKWLFIGPAVIFMLLLATKFLNAWYGTSFDAVMIDAANADDWIYLVIFAVFIFLAATIPLKMGNEIYGKIKDGWNKSSKLPWVGVPKRMVDSRIKNIERRRAAGDQMRIAKLSQKGTLGRLATGLTAREADARKMDLLKSMGELLPESKDGLATEIEKAKVGSLEEQAIVYKAITTGNLDDKSERMRDAVLTYADPTQEKFIPGLEKALPKENADFDVSAAMAGDPRYRDRALISLKKILPNEYKAKHWEYTPTDDTVITNAKGESIKISGLRSIALQKSQIDAGLKGKPEVREAFARRMYETGAHGLVQDIDQYNDIVTTAGHPELVRPKNTSEPAPPTPQPQSPQSVPDSINENRYTKRESGILIPREQNSGRTAQDGQSTNPQQPPTDTENPGSDGNSPT